ncbi:hypothetical protein J6590_020719 [Homalodisca vitripennis]|nr:hypothetical protein J6590_020719 [Homalodisca vitripennis]
MMKQGLPRYMREGLIERGEEGDKDSWMKGAEEAKRSEEKADKTDEKTYFLLPKRYMRGEQTVEDKEGTSER